MFSTYIYTHMWQAHTIYMYLVLIELHQVTRVTYSSRFTLNFSSVSDERLLVSSAFSVLGKLELVGENILRKEISFQAIS